MSDRVDLRDYLVVSIWFGCNNDCSICMLSGMRDELPPIGFDRYRHLLGRVQRDGRFTKLILSGAEVTTCPDLDRYIEYAASLDYFDVIQIQTNGRKLHEPAYAKRLVACGVNEFFVSIHATQEIHDAITGRKGSFAQTMAGIRTLSALDVNVISNTVLTGLNCGAVSPLFQQLAGERVSEIHLWNYFPMDKTDDADLVVSLADVLDLVPAVAPVAASAGIPLVLKAFPECLSVDPAAVIDSGYPETVLPNAFWKRFGECGFGTCPHRETCAARECWGLSGAYADRYGDERDLLEPRRE